MKILIVRMWADVLNISNYNCQEVGLAKALVRKGNVCDIVLYTDKDKSYEEDLFFDNDKKIHIYYLKAKNILKNCIYENKLYEITKNYDIVQTAEYDQIGNIKLRKKVNNKMVIYHGPYACEYTKGYRKKCLISDLYYLFNKDYKNTPCLSKSSLATNLLKNKGFKNVETVGVGLDIDRFENNVELNGIVKEIIDKKEKENLKYLLYIGKIEDRRNIPFLIDILDEVSRKNDNIRLLLIGKGEEKYINNCFAYAKEKNVFEKIIYYSAIPQTELPNLYRKCDIFLLPTQYEIFGMVLLEAMYFGIPTITTLNGGSSTLIEHEKDGFICELNIKQWVNHVTDLLEDSNYKEEISCNAIKKVKNNFNWNCLAEKFINIYFNVIK